MNAKRMAQSALLLGVGLFGVNRAANFFSLPGTPSHLPKESPPSASAPRELHPVPRLAGLTTRQKGIPVPVSSQGRSHYPESAAYVPAGTDTAEQSLFAAVAPSQSANQLVNKDPTILRSRSVNLNLGAFVVTDSDHSTSVTLRDRLRLELFEDVSFSAVLDRAEIRSEQDFTWIGHVEGVDYSLVTFVVKDGVVAGNIRLAESDYQVRYVADGVHVIHQIDQRAFPEEIEPIPVDTTMLDPMSTTAEPLVSAAPAASMASDSGPIIDVLVVYTPAARAGAGGTTAMRALVDLAISETNTAYANSLINARIRLAHTAEVTYTESGDLLQDLAALQDRTDAFMNEVHTLRDQYGADLVALIVNGGNACGIAFLMNAPSSAYAGYAFSVTTRGCAVGNYSFGHELGHNMGSNHDHANSNFGGSYPYSFGYQAPNSTFRTVMAYDCPVGCQRLLYFSNPNVHYQGQATGSANWADNARSLNNTTPIVANWRASATSPATPDILVSPTSSDFGVVGVNRSATKTFSIFNQGAAALEVRTLSFNGLDAQNFSIRDDNCSTRQIPQATGCSFSVFFTPTSANKKTATLIVQSNDPKATTVPVTLLGEGRLGETAELDHFKCYAATPAIGTRRFASRTVKLSDEFETKKTTVLRPTDICNAVDKNGAGIKSPGAHLTCYQIKDAPGQARFARQDTLVTDDFGTMTLTAAKADALCLPSEQDSLPADLSFDDFKCYTATPASGTRRFAPRTVSLSDEFETKKTTVLRPTSLCNAVDKNGAGLTNPGAHLTCYQIRDVAKQTPFTRRDIAVTDDFGTAALTAVKPSALCVPSE